MIDETAGSVKRKAGKLTGNINLQAEGVAQQVLGKVETTLGKAKDAVLDANQPAAVQHGPHV
jgi:uncharacterized protein YjbJ (UPF0337 family)